MPTSVALSPHFEGFIQEQVKSGRYNNASEVVRAALRLMEDQRSRESMQREELRNAITAGLASVRGQTADSVFGQPEAKYRKQTRRSA